MHFFFVADNTLCSYKNVFRKFNLNLFDFHNLLKNNELKTLLNGAPSLTLKILTNFLFRFYSLNLGFKPCRK